MIGTITGNPSSTGLCIGGLNLGTMAAPHLPSFENEDIAPVELFIRYKISQPVGLERYDACVRALAESVASMELE